MLVIKPRAQGAGLIDIISKVTNSALAKKVISSAVGKKIIEKATKENFRKAANSAIGKQLKLPLLKVLLTLRKKLLIQHFKN